MALPPAREADVALNGMRASFLTLAGAVCCATLASAQERSFHVGKTIKVLSPFDGLDVPATVLVRADEVIE